MPLEDHPQCRDCLQDVPVVANALPASTALPLQVLFTSKSAACPQLQPIVLLTHLTLKKSSTILQSVVVQPQQQSMDNVPQADVPKTLELPLFLSDPSCSLPWITGSSKGSPKASLLPSSPTSALAVVGVAVEAAVLSSDQASTASIAGVVSCD